MDNETKIIYYLDDQETPYLVKVSKPLDNVTLRDFKLALNRLSYKYFFKSMDDDFGVVKEEVIDDDSRLPGYNGRVIAWLISTEGSVSSETKSQHSISTSIHDCSNSQTTQNSTTNGGSQTPIVTTATVTTTNLSDYNIEHGRNAVNSLDALVNHQNYRKTHRLRELNDDTTETESLSSALKDLRLHRSSSRRHYNSFNHHLQNQNRRSMKTNMMQHPHYKPPYHHYDASSLMSSELDTTTFFDSENDDQFSSVTESTTMSSKRYGAHRKKRLKHKLPSQTFDDTASSVSSMTDSTMSLNIITVILNLDTVNFLGISIVGQSNKGGDGGIYVGSIMSGGAVAQDGRIEPGDMILQVNDISFENMSNEDAVKVLREAVMKPGPIKLVVAKCWDPNPKGYFTVSKQDPIKPIDPTAWVAHTAAHSGAPMPQRQHQQYHHPNGRYLPQANSLASFGSTSSLTNSMTETETRYGNDNLNLTVNTDMETVVRAMSAQDSGLEIRNRNWLKITIPNAFIGSDVVDWLFNHVEGFPDRRDARKYACNMLKHNFIRHAVNKMRFSEQCYYVFGDASCLAGNGTLFTLDEETEDFDSVSEYDRDTLCSGIMGPMQPAHRQHMLPPPPPSYLSTTTTSSANSSACTTATSGIVSQTEKNFHLYYPPANSANMMTSGMGGQTTLYDQTDAQTYCTSGINSQYTSGVSISQQNYNSYAAPPSVYSNNSGGSKENRSLKSSDNSSSGGHGSDTELISRNKKSSAQQRPSKYQNPNISQQTSTTVSYKFKSHISTSTTFDDTQSSTNSFYQLGNFDKNQQIYITQKSTGQHQQPPQLQQQRSLDKVPKELRTSKQSFQMAMGNPCEFFVDVM